MPQNLIVEQVKKLIDQSVKQQFGNKMIGDNPTDALQLVNKRYAVTGGPGSIMSFASVVTIDPNKGRLHTIITSSVVGTSTINASVSGLYGQQLQLIIKNDNDAARTVAFGNNFRASSIVGIASLAATISFTSNSSVFFETSRTLGL